MEKKNNFIIIIIVALSILVGLLGGYILSNALTSKTPTANNNESKIPNNEQDNTKTEDDNSTEQDKGGIDFPLTEAQSLMDKYKYESCNSYVYLNSMEENDSYDQYLINNICMSHIKSEKVSCSSIYGKSEIDFDSGHFCYDYTYFYKYNELLNKKMELFGNDSQLAKEAFGNKITKYDYISKKDGFVWLDFSGGGDCYIPTESIITSAKIIENELKVTLIEKEYDSDEYDKGNKIVSSEGKREYIFRKQNNNYYLAEINKVN